jgi:DNA gyrase/topoisomerase IV subunit B
VFERSALEHAGEEKENLHVHAGYSRGEKQKETHSEITLYFVFCDSPLVVGTTTSIHRHREGTHIEDIKKVY